MFTTAMFTVDQYDYMIAKGAFTGPNHRRIELIRGEIVEMSPIGPLHNWVVSELAEWSISTVGQSKVRVSIQGPIRIAAIESEPEPDVVWAKRKNYRDKHIEPADVLLLIEVAESSLAYDRTEKLAAYAEAGIPDYWIVDLVGERVEVYREPVGTTYRSHEVFAPGDLVTPLCASDVRLRVAKLFGESE